MIRSVAPLAVRGAQDAVKSMSRLPSAFHRALLVSVLLSTSAAAATDAGRRGRDWVSGVVTKIARAAAEKASDPSTSGTVTIRLRIGFDGALADAGIDEGSGSAALDERALRAAKAASPFRPPPSGLLTLEGYTELSFPLQLGGAAAR